MAACAEAVVANAATPAADMVCIMKTRRFVGVFIKVLCAKLVMSPEHTGRPYLSHRLAREID
jgi:hypothetical protein